MKPLLILLFLFTFNYAQTFSSKEYKTPLIELYTSQGCSSCPSADKWLSSLKNEPKLFKEFIPLAFHVTYWDFLGWKDKFANIKNDIRQRQYSKIWDKNSLYTPQFIVNAKEYRRWFYTKKLPKYKKEYGGVLKVKITGQKLDIEYKNKKIKNKELTINIALLGMDYSIPVKRGENAHKILRHDFVVLNHQKETSFIRNNTLNHKTKIDLKKEYKALVVWLSDKKLNQLQALGTYLK